MRFHLADLIRRIRNPRRSTIPLREIVPPAMLAADLYRSTYGRVVAAWERAIPRLLAAYARPSLRDAALTTDGLDDFLRVFADITDELQRILIELAPGLRDWTVKVEGWHRGRWTENVRSGTGVDISLEQPPPGGPGL